MRDENNAAAQDVRGRSTVTDTKMICILYVAFFLVWCAGLAIGVVWTGDAQPRWFGVPVWFILGCVVSSVAVAIALVACLRRWFK